MKTKDLIHRLNVLDPDGEHIVYVCEYRTNGYAKYGITGVLPDGDRIAIVVGDEYKEE